MTIRKVDVATGLHWLEFPEADLRVLCACPADAVKHLMKRGLIHPVEEGGVTFETGPNAILLSDVGLQNGHFSNLAEFPVLQMLYRQGLILPGHPNNTGKKPLLIGAQDQVRAQLEYIFRGNYGLVSEKEMVEAGVAPSSAKDWMRLKLKFAFGSIRPSRDLLDTLVVEDQPVDIVEGVSIRRTAINVFQFEHQGETVEVDLNLAAAEQYEPPYVLGFHNLRREFFSVIHSGEGDGWDINRPSMSSVITFQGRIYLVDAGPNIDTTLRSLGIGIQEVEGIFHTHAHDDHFSGLTALIRADHKLKYFATPFVRVTAAKKMGALLSISDDAFGDYFEIHDLELDAWNDIDGLEIKPVFSPHPVETTVFLFRARTDTGYKTYAHMADICSLSILRGMITEDNDAPGLSQDAFDRVSQEYLIEADLKKLDIGGGLIHGEARDFATDRSAKLILAHRASPFTVEEKEIGSGAPFGIVDVLIPSQRDYMYKSAFSFIKAYYPQARNHQIETLLNYPLSSFNPESFLGREGDLTEEVLLILNGQVEVLEKDGVGQGLLIAGAVIGESSAIGGMALTRTYRATSFVNALTIPAPLFRQFIEQSGQTDEVRRIYQIRTFLEQTRVFQENMSYQALSGLAQQANMVELEAGDEVDWGDGDLLILVRDGELELRLGGQSIDTLGAAGTCGETCVLFGVAPVYQAVAVGRVSLLCLPAFKISRIPAARWKLLEMYHRRMHGVVARATGDGDTFQWLDEYAIHIPDMDEQHKMLFELANVVITEINSGADREAVSGSMDALIDYTHLHFEAEENLLNQVDYDRLTEHQTIHSGLIMDIEALNGRIAKGDDVGAGEFRSFFLAWILFHILAEDRKYVRFMKSK